MHMHSDYDDDGNPILNWLTGVVGIALVSQLVMPRNQTAKILEATTNGFAQSIRAATGGVVNRDTRSSAEIFHARAMQAVAEFWEGFVE
jgi:hypothetical protein